VLTDVGEQAPLLAAEAHLRVGEAELALDAYRRAGAATGLRPHARPRVRAAGDS
jgi:hypothetical protein